MRIRRRQYSLDERRYGRGLLLVCASLVIPGKGIFSLSKPMARALQLARRGQFSTSPNPMVGAVVVDSSGTIVGEGYHRKAGGPHAEVYALRQAGSKANGATLYVTLEPCNHYGRTPPCTESIIQSGIKAVHIATLDPNPHVRGGGVDRLESEGIQVYVGENQVEAEALNRPFMTWSKLARPLVTLKAAMSLDGKIAGWQPTSRYLSSPQSLSFGHDLRRSHDAVLIGINTLLTDDPTLTYRGRGAGRDPIRVVIDSRGRAPADARIFHSGSMAPTLVYTTDAAPVEWEREVFSAGGEVVRVNATPHLHVDLKAVLHDLATRHVLSVLVEGGAIIHGTFLSLGLADRWISLVSPLLIGAGGFPAVLGSHFSPSIPGQITKIKRLGPDLMIETMLLSSTAISQKG